MKDDSSKQQAKQKYKPNHQQTRVPPHSELQIRGKTNKNSAQVSPYTKLTQTNEPNLEGQTKMKKEFNLLQGKNSTFLEVCKKETTNTIT